MKAYPYRKIKADANKGIEHVQKQRGSWAKGGTRSYHAQCGTGRGSSLSPWKTRKGAPSGGNLTLRQYKKNANMLKAADSGATMQNREVIMEERRRRSGNLTIGGDK